MEKSIKNIAVPFLRTINFRGSFPRFYYHENGCIVNVHFQFKSYGGAFCVNVDGVDREKGNFGFPSFRLGGQGTDRWFVFEPNKDLYSHFKEIFEGRYIGNKIYEIYGHWMYEETDDLTRTEIIANDLIRLIQHEIIPLMQDHSSSPEG